MNYYAQAIEIITSKRADWFEIVTKIAAKHPKAVVDAAQGDWQKEAKSLVAAGRKLDAIKLYRNSTGCNLIDVKDVIERLTD